MPFRVHKRNITYMSHCHFKRNSLLEIMVYKWSNCLCNVAHKPSARQLEKAVKPVGQECTGNLGGGGGGVSSQSLQLILRKPLQLNFSVSILAGKFFNCLFPRPTHAHACMFNRFLEKIQH
jgi:hypothetical protein